MAVQRALISVFDKTGIVEFAKRLAALKIEMLSTGGTAKLLREFQIAPALPVALHEDIETPFDFGGRALAAAAEILVVFDLELTNVPFELAQIFVDGRHGWRKTPESLC